MDTLMVKSVLMIAFHYPPMRGSSGIQRTLRFTQHLPALGWKPIVLTANLRAYHDHCAGLEGDIPAQADVTRAFALDAARHLSLAGRFPRWLALPDRWSSWVLGALPAGLRLVRRHRPAAIWSTYPIASAHLAGLALHRLTGLPWIADMRDPMTDVDYPPDRLVRRASAWIERMAVRHCAAAVCTTPGALRSYRARFTEVPAGRFALIENGFDEESFASAPVSGRRDGARFTLVHSGVIYPSERDPSALFAALGRMLREGDIAAGGFELVLRASGHEDYLVGLAARHGVAGIVTVAPPLPYRDALAEMLCADGLLLLQAANCNQQIPAKLYEYLRAQRPILALTDATGDTACALRHAGIDTIAPLDDAGAILHALRRFLQLVRSGRAPLAPMDAVAACSRHARSAELARLLDRVVTARQEDVCSQP